MTEIKITKIEHGFKAETKDDVFTSINGVDWVYDAGYRPLMLQSLRIAFHKFMLSEQEQEPKPVKPKVGDWIMAEKDSGPIKYKTLHQISNVCVGGVEVQNPQSLSVCVFLRDSEYTIAPAPETFTGDPSKWGEGVYLSSAGSIMVFVDVYGRWFATGRIGISISGPLTLTYTRISANLADAIDWERVRAMREAGGVK